MKKNSPSAGAKKKKESGEWRQKKARGTPRTFYYLSQIFPKVFSDFQRAGAFIFSFKFPPERTHWERLAPAFERALSFFLFKNAERFLKGL